MADTVLDSVDASANYGGSAYLGFNAGVYRTLIAFDVGTLDKTRRLEKATLRLSAEGNYGPSGQPIPVEAYAITQTWTEGTDDGSRGGDGATWNRRNKVNPWQTPGGTYRTPAVGAVTLPAGFSSGWLEMDVTVIVQEWVDKNTGNNGLLLLSRTSDTPYFTSRDSADVASRPQLVVTYSGSAPPPAQPLY